MFFGKCSINIYPLIIRERFPCNRYNIVVALSSDPSSPLYLLKIIPDVFQSASHSQPLNVCELDYVALVEISAVCVVSMWWDEMTEKQSVQSNENVFDYFI